MIVEVDEQEATMTKHELNFHYSVRVAMELVSSG